MKKLYIIGAGGLGREVLSIANAVNRSEKQNWVISGFIDDNINALDGLETGGIRVVDTINNHIIKDSNIYVCAVANSEIRKTICENYLENGAEFISLIHPTCVVGLNNSIGKGLIMSAYSSISENVTIGDFVIINGYTGIGHDAKIGDYVTLSAHCDITGHTCLGEKVFLGSSAVISPGVFIEDNARVGAGSVVIKRVKSNTTVFGNPAKRIY